ncbi:hypothetical protein [Actinomyces bowdenii]|uniref:Uncharacterized protein n=1 Tax=Actinomyces bowdenii TaxID=131109 RepID=A0A3P1VC12_9ACTO|nr:hypothetical protein [Actinomyces bowdenii]RRD31030.1 hypothetical protein EII10_02155 [Actinomyces bowdenii]
MRAFRPGPGFIIVLALGALVILLALSAAISTALGARGVSSILGGMALIIVGLGLLAVLRVPARSLVVNAPRLRLERNRARAARARREQEARVVGRWWARRRGVRPGAPAPAGGSGTGGPAGPRGASGGGTGLAPLTVPGTSLVIPESTGRRELTTLDVVSGPLTTALATTRIGRAADERLAGTTAGESLVRVGQLLLGALGFVLIALGLASVLGQVIA